MYKIICFNLKNSFILEMAYAVDMQGFKKPGNDFVLKELAIMSLDEDVDPIVLLFKAPFSWRKLTTKYKRENLWLELYYHGLNWESGDLEYTEIGNILRDSLKDATKIYVNSEIKKKWLERFNFEVSDLTESGYPPFTYPKSATVCTHHNGAYKAMCALHNVKLMKYYYLNDSAMEWEDIPCSQD